MKSVEQPNLEKASSTKINNGFQKFEKRAFRATGD